MPLTQTNLLVSTYGSLLEGSLLDNDPISDEKLLQLLQTLFGESQTGFDINMPVEDKNHDPTQATYDFVHTVCQTLPPQALHYLTEKMILLATKIPNFDFVQIHPPHLVHVFLAFEMLNQPESANEHFESAFLKKMFPTNHAMKQFKDTDMYSIVTDLKILASYPKLPQLEGTYRLALQNLEFKTIAESPQVRDMLKLFLSTVESLTSNKIPPEWIIRLMLQTSDFLEGRMSIYNYKLLARKIPDAMPIVSKSRSLASGLFLGSIASIVGPLTGAFFAQSASYIGKPLLRGETGFSKIIDELVKIITAENALRQAQSIMSIALKGSPHRKEEEEEDAPSAKFLQYRIATPLKVTLLPEVIIHDSDALQQCVDQNLLVKIEEETKEEEMLMLNVLAKP